MNLRVRLRLALVLLGIGLAGLLLGGMTLTSWQRTKELRSEYRRANIESFRIGDQFKDFVRELNDAMLDYGVRHDPASFESFTNASEDLDEWIDAQSPLLKTEVERSIMQQIDRAFDAYRTNATELHQRILASGSKRLTIEDFSGLLAGSQSLFDLGEALAEAHHQELEVAPSRANQVITEIQFLMLLSLGLLFALGAALATVVYRDMIAPLRVQLVESRTLAERQEKLASLGMLAAGVAHEIRNPLTAIKAALFLQQKKFQPGTPEFADARVVEREILRLERIVNDFLLFARPRDPEFTETSVELILHDVQTLLAPKLAEANIELTLEKGPQARIRVDPAQLKQVLINLVQNGADSIGENGTIQLRAHETRMRLSGADTAVVVLEVADSGKGIPAEVQKRLFDPFFTTKEGGSGLGLSIAAGIIQKHGGALQYQTQKDHGTTFGIILPRLTT